MKKVPKGKSLNVVSVTRGDESLVMETNTEKIPVSPNCSGGPDVADGGILGWSCIHVMGKSYSSQSFQQTGMRVLK